jgi:hypothetical protein
VTTMRRRKSVPDFFRIWIWKCGWENFPITRNYFFEIRTVKRLRPFWRRRFKTFLPPGVLILFRKP